MDILVSSVKMSIESSSPNLYVLDNSVVLDKRVAALHQVSVIFKIDDLSINVGSQFIAVICGYEKITPKSGIS